jgi:hypothetical protein
MLGFAQHNFVLESGKVTVDQVNAKRIRSSVTEENLMEPI